MWDDAHAIGLIGVIAVSAAFVIGDFGFRPRLTYLIGIALVGSIGLLSAFVLNARGKPFLEWLLPLGMFLLAGSFINSEARFRAFAVSMFAAAIALTLSFLSLVSGPYATELDRPTQAHNRAILQHVSTRIGKLSGDLPHAPVASIIGPVESPVVVSERQLWHTWFTRLRLRKSATIWSPGGDARYVARNLQVHPNK